METYYKPEHLPKFEEIGKEAPDLAKKFFDYYDAVFSEGELTEREKSLVGLAVDQLMCRTMVSVSWDGCLYDCDFNLARRLYTGGSRIHISEMTGPPEPGSPVAVADHCYTCTAGAGFT